MPLTQRLHPSHSRLGVKAPAPSHGDRGMNPALNPTLVREAALIAGVCARPVVARVADNESGEVRVVPISCGSTREDRCPPCADRAKRLRIQQCREGWHLDTEPEHAPA